MESKKNSTKTDIDINQDLFFMLLKSDKIEMAINSYAHKEILMYYNNKKRSIQKITWIKYLKKYILNKCTEVVQFKIERDGSTEEEYSIRIFMICKKINGTLDFTEIILNTNWQDNYISKMHYKLISY
jgi:hypothetical protein